MGFTYWPADLTDEGVAVARDYAQARGDIVAISFIGGIPWPEAFDGKPFSKAVQENLNNRPAPGKKLFLSISPLNKDRRDLAPYWGDAENQPLPKPWDKEPLNSARVKRAYLNFVLRAVDAMGPDYLAIGVESNMLLSRDSAKWRQLMELHRDTYSAVKKVHKTLPVFFTTEVLHYKRLARDAKGSAQEKEVGEMMRYSDMFAMSLYPHMSPEVPRPVSPSFLDFATRFKKPIVVAESGMNSRQGGTKILRHHAPWLGRRPAAVYRTAAQDRGARQLRVRHQLRHHGFRPPGRQTTPAARRHRAHMGLYRHANQRQASQAGLSGVGWILSREV